MKIGCWRTISVGLALSLVLGGCTKTTWDPTPEPGRSSAERAAEIARQLRPVDDWRASVSLRQRVTVRWPDGVARFDAVLEKRAKRLRLVGLGPMNTPGFVLTLDPGGLEVMNRSGRTMPFAPEFILADVQRVFYPWTIQAPGCSRCESDLPGIDVFETLESDGTRVRTFRASGRPEIGSVDVRLGEASAVRGIPARANVTNGWLGYDIEVETFAADEP